MRGKKGRGTSDIRGSKGDHAAFTGNVIPILRGDLEKPKEGFSKERKPVTRGRSPLVIRHAKSL